MLALKSNRVFFSISKLKNDCKDSGSMNRTGVWVKKEKKLYIYIYQKQRQSEEKTIYIQEKSVLTNFNYHVLKSVLI